LRAALVADECCPWLPRGGVASMPVRGDGAEPTIGILRLPACTPVPPWGFAGSSWESALFDTSLGRARAACLRDASGAREPARGSWRRRGRAGEAWLLAL